MLINSEYLIHHLPISANILLYQQQEEANAGEIWISPKEAWHSYHDRNKCRRCFICEWFPRSGDVVSVGSSNVKAIDDESSELFFPIAWKIVSPSSLPPSVPSLPSQIPAKQAAVSRISQQDESEFSHALWGRIHKYSFGRVAVEGCKSRVSAGAWNG